MRSSFRCKTWLILLCVLMLSQPIPVHADAAATYYVATNGSDQTGDGSSGRPWSTITYALQHITDGSLILVRPGLYTGQVQFRGNFAQGVTIRAEKAYQSLLRNNMQVVVASGSTSGITLEGFNIAHTGPGAGVLVVQINGGDVLGRTHDITIRNNVLHDSFNNDILKIASGATRVVVEGNVFYNQTGSDEHIDVNSASDVVIQDNIFFNDFAASGRSNTNTTSNYIVIKDSGGNSDGLLGSRNITVRRNIFLNWEGMDSSAFVMVGEDGQPFYEAQGVMIENNLMLGNSPNSQRSPLGVWGSKDVTFRNNTVSGDMPSAAYGMLLAKTSTNLANANINFYNNIWSDPTGTMGAGALSSKNDFSDTKPEATASFRIDHNLYWNGGGAIPSDSTEKVNYTNDAHRIVADPGLKSLSGITIPYWSVPGAVFADGSATIRDAFVLIAARYAGIAKTSPVVDAADPANAPSVDILGRQRDDAPDIGAFEYISAFGVQASPSDQGITLTWSLNGELPAGASWEISYDGPTGASPSPVSGIPAGQRSFQLTGMQNYYPYTVTVSAVDQGNKLFGSTVQAMPTNIFVFLPGVRRK